MKLTAAEYHALLRTDLCAFTQRAFYELNPNAEFLPNWHIEMVCAELEACRRGETRRLIINQPPRSLKSLCTSVAFVAYLLGHNPSAQIICASYGQDLTNKHASDCRTLMSSSWYRKLFPHTRLASDRQALQELTTTAQGARLGTSIGGVLTGRGADTIIIDDPLKPEEALSESQRKTVNEWCGHTLYSRLNDKRTGCIILIMQRLHEDDLVGHVLKLEPWKLIRLPAIAEQDENYLIQTPFGPRHFARRGGEALHPEREPLEVLNRLRETVGDYNFAGQYQQSPAPLDGGLVKQAWFNIYTATEVSAKFEFIFQSWDTANTPNELADYSVCTTWGVRDKHLFLLHVCRKRVNYPELKRAVREQADAFGPKTILIEDRASGTQLIQELVSEGMHEIARYQTTMDKVMRMHSVTSTIANGFVHLPERAAWLAEYLHELVTFPNGRFDDQVDSTSQALDWLKAASMNDCLGLLDFYKKKKEEAQKQVSSQSSTSLTPRPCPKCGAMMTQIVSGQLRCQQCGEQWPPPQTRVPQFTRKDILDREPGFPRRSPFSRRRW